MADRVDRDLDLSVGFETIERVLNPAHRDGLAGGGAPGSNQHLVALEAEHAVWATGHRSKFTAY